MILAEALLGAENGQGVSYSRRKIFYSIGKRYRAPTHTYATVLRSVDELVQEGWLYEHRVAPNNRGWQSSFCATPELIAAAQDLTADPKFEVREPIRLKDDADDLVDYPESDVESFRKVLADAVIFWEPVVKSLGLRID